MNNDIPSIDMTEFLTRYEANSSVFTRVIFRVSQWMPRRVRNWMQEYESGRLSRVIYRKLDRMACRCPKCNAMRRRLEAETGSALADLHERTRQNG